MKLKFAVVLGLLLTATAPAIADDTYFTDPLTGPSSPHLGTIDGDYTYQPLGLSPGLARTTSDMTNGHGSFPIDRPMVKTLSGGFLNTAFVAELTVKTSVGGNDLIYIGFGQGVANPGYFDEPTNSIYFRIHSGATHVVQAAYHSGTATPSWGPHNLADIGTYTPAGTTFRIEKCGDDVTLSIVGGGSKTWHVSDLALGTLDGSNSHIFFGNSIVGTTFSNLVLSPPSLSGPNRLTNGSFEGGAYDGAEAGWWQWVHPGETHMTAWTVDGPYPAEGVNWINSPLGGWSSADGDKNVELDRLSTISQSFSTVVGETYTVVFSMSGNYFPTSLYNPITKTVLVSAGDFSQEFTFENDGSHWQSVPYETRSFCFVATGPTSTITFAGQDDSYFAAVIDNVIVNGPAPTNQPPVAATPGRTKPVPMRWSAHLLPAHPCPLTAQGPSIRTMTRLPTPGGRAQRFLPGPPLPPLSRLRL